MIQFVRAYSHKLVHEGLVGKIRSWSERDYGGELVLYPMIVFVRQQLKKKMVILGGKTPKSSYLLLAEVVEVFFEFVSIKMDLALEPKMKNMFMDLILIMCQGRGGNQRAVHQMIKSFGFQYGRAG